MACSCTGKGKGLSLKTSSGSGRSWPAWFGREKYRVMAPAIKQINKTKRNRQIISEEDALMTAFISMASDNQNSCDKQYRDNSFLASCDKQYRKTPSWLLVTNSTGIISSLLLVTNSTELCQLVTSIAQFNWRHTYSYNPIGRQPVPYRARARPSRVRTLVVMLFLELQ